MFSVACASDFVWHAVRCHHNVEDRSMMRRGVLQVEGVLEQKPDEIQRKHQDPQGDEGDVRSVSVNVQFHH